MVSKVCTSVSTTVKVSRYSGLLLVTLENLEGFIVLSADDPAHVFTKIFELSGNYL